MLRRAVLVIPVKNVRNFCTFFILGLGIIIFKVNKNIFVVELFYLYYY